MPLMMLAVELYLATMLGVSGLAKLDNPKLFAATLRRHGILPQPMVTPVSVAIPWLEVAVAVVIVSGLLPVVAASVTTTLLLSFLATEVILVVQGRATQCGCFGVAFEQRVDGASIVVSTVLCVLAGVNLVGSVAGVRVTFEWRSLAIALFTAFGAALVGRMMVMSRRRCPNCRMIHSHSNERSAVGV